MGDEKPSVKRLAALLYRLSEAAEEQASLASIKAILAGDPETSLKLFRLAAEFIKCAAEFKDLAKKLEEMEVEADEK